MIILTRSNNSKHKFTAMFPDGTITRFGAKGYQDYTMHKDPDRMKRYIIRHGGSGQSSKYSTKENWGRTGTKTAGFWSRWLLWSEPNFRKALKKTEKIIGQKIIYK